MWGQAGDWCILWLFQLIYTEVQVHSLLEAPPEYNQDHTPLTNQAWL